jgi:hypothetical protein
MKMIDQVPSARELTFTDLVQFVFLIVIIDFLPILSQLLDGLILFMPYQDQQVTRNCLIINLPEEKEK